MTTDTNLPEIEFPADERKSRINRPPRSEAPDDVATAGDRIAAFWEKYPNGSILPEIDRVIVDNGEAIPYNVYTVRAFIRKDAQSEQPDSVAHATRGENDEDEITRQFPQETAETSAISRALRNLGILPNGNQPEPPAPERSYDTRSQHPLAIARKAANMSQRDLGKAMGERGHEWSQGVVSKVENGHRELRNEEITALTELVGYRGDS
ncbi:helix-turn-helix domain-containing protein [Microbacterium sp. NPDC089696]|uniref:helix-turn-helix domain-containing protein n=1 Tax=Microbacterium sp. NPDC089696 TaxID=3364199 RepID=UPI0037F50932